MGHFGRIFRDFGGVFGHFGRVFGAFGRVFWDLFPSWGCKHTTLDYRWNDCGYLDTNVGEHTVMFNLYNIDQNPANL